MTPRKSLAALSLAALSALSGCAGSTAGKVPADIPDWYLNQPSGNGLYGTGMIQSRSLQLAKEQADFAGCKEIAKSLSQKVEGLTKQYLGQEGAVGSSEAREALSEAARSIVNVTLSGCVNRKHEVRMAPDGSYTVYSLEFLDPAAAVAAAKNARDAQQALSQSKQTFQELDNLLNRDLQAGAGR
jgi:hypothetical protein